jgi:type II secretory ATPase GspE/PulE/Tfp pilus assembly ATPase PilB-like protein
VDLRKCGKKPDIIKSISDLPRKITHFSPMYEPSDQELFIPVGLRDHVIALVDPDATEENKSILLLTLSTAENNEWVSENLRRLFTNYLASTKRLPSALYLCVLENEDIRDVILASLKEKESMKPKQSDAGDSSKGIKKAEALLVNAMKLKASDIHIESDGSRAVIRLRIHKELIDFAFETHAESKALSTIFYSSFTRGNDTDQDKGQGDGLYLPGNLLDGEFSRIIGDYNIKSRMVNIGLNNQETYTMVMRLIDKSKSRKPLTFDELNYSNEAKRSLQTLRSVHKGIVLVVGITGSGKSTLLQTLIQLERDRCGNTRKIYSIEQPVEQVMPRIIQISALDSHGAHGEKKSDQDFSFSNINRNLMRGDPDSISYGEVRDEQTANALITGGESGHLVYGTMHTESAIGAFSRLQSFKIPLEKLCRSQFIKLIVFQHLLTRICPKCSIPYSEDVAIPDRFDEFHAITSHRNKDGVGIDMLKILDVKSKLKPGQRLIRQLQREQLITSKDVAAMLNKIQTMNLEDDEVLQRRRIQNMILNSTLPPEKNNIRFRGHGCDNKGCFNGAIGVVPVVESLIPDDTFLNYIYENKTSKAEKYWQTNLRGQAVHIDAVSKILSGDVDPRSIEELN